jgi:hypothetical protein
MTVDQTPTGINWLQFVLSSVVMPALISVGLSAYVNHRMNLRLQKKEEEMGIVKDKLNLYAFLISRFDEMKYTFEVIRSHRNLPQNPNGFVFRGNDWNKFVEDIDNRIKEHYNLLSEEIEQKWIYVKTLPSDPSSARVLSDLRRMLIDEYNNMRETDLKHLQHRIRKLSHDKPVLDFSKYKSNSNEPSNPS